MGVGVMMDENADSTGRERRSRARGRNVIVAALACRLIVTLAAGALAQGDSEAPKGSLPETTIAPSDGGVRVPPAGEGSLAPSEPAPAPTHRKSHHAATHKTSSAQAEPATGMLKLNQDSWAYAAPDKSSG